MRSPHSRARAPDHCISDEAPPMLPPSIHHTLTRTLQLIFNRNLGASLHHPSIHPSIRSFVLDTPILYLHTWLFFSCPIHASILISLSFPVHSPFRRPYVCVSLPRMEERTNPQDQFNNTMHETTASLPSWSAGVVGRELPLAYDQSKYAVSHARHYTKNTRNRIAKTMKTRNIWMISLRLPLTPRHTFHSS